MGAAARGAAPRRVVRRPHDRGGVPARRGSPRLAQRRRHDGDAESSDRARRATGRRLQSDTSTGELAARHHPRRPRRLLRVGGAAAPARAARPAGHRRRRRRELPARRGQRRIVRGAPFRRALGDAAGARAATLPARGGAAGGLHRVPRAPRARSSRWRASSLRRWSRSRSTRRTSTSPARSGAWARPTRWRATCATGSRRSAQLDASCGVATSKMVAKVASDLEKPRGMVVVPPGDEAAFLAPLPLRRLPGLGPASEKALASLGLMTLGDLAAFPLPALRRRLGEHAAISLSERARGIDRSEVTVPERPKSISREETFSEDVSDRAELHRLLRACAADVGRQLRHGRWAARTATLKLRYSDFATYTRQLTWPDAAGRRRRAGAGRDAAVRRRVVGRAGAPARDGRERRHRRGAARPLRRRRRAARHAARPHPRHPARAVRQRGAETWRRAGAA